MSTEERELRLVNAVELKILGVANNEEKLQALLNTYLPPLLLKAASPHDAVRAKVQAVYQLVHRYVKPTG
jgi:proteasome component ECM29